MPSRLRRRGIRALKRVSTCVSDTVARLDDPRIRITAAEEELISPNAALRGLHSGRPGFVIGNGPSIVGQDLAPLAGQVTFVANGFRRHPLMDLGPAGEPPTWQPSYYALIDPAYTDGTDSMATFFASILARTTRCKFFLPINGMHVVREQKLIPMSRACPVLLRGNIRSFSGVSYDLASTLPELQCVSLMGIAAALYTGCNPVYLLGMDHDWLSSPQKDSVHFYKGLTVENSERCRQLQDGSSYSYLENLEAISLLYRSYYILQAAAAEIGVTILNATDGGFLDVFPRVDYEQVISSLEADPETKAHETISDGSTDEKAHRKTRLAASL